MKLVRTLLNLFVIVAVLCLPHSGEAAEEDWWCEGGYGFVEFGQGMCTESRAAVVCADVCGQDYCGGCYDGGYTCSDPYYDPDLLGPGVGGMAQDIECPCMCVEGER